ncbi:MAG TPA: hypothetical protein VN688_21140 [Gemmataceae bacterium]|nr:hypothetical protein [Gemmataceae bacterium]
MSTSPNPVPAQFGEEHSALNIWEGGGASSSIGIAPPSVSQARRIRLFRIAPGFLSDPIGLQDDDSMAGILGVPSLGSPASPIPSDDGLDWVQFGVGTDNPYFDLRRPGDPGGVGYYRMNTQVQLLDSPTTACTFGLQAVTPAGIQFAGVPDGPTVVSPAFSVFHAVNDRMAIQGFVAKNVAIRNADSTGLLQRNVQYGLAVQRPIVANGPEGLRSLFFSVGALGQIRPEGDSLRLLPTCEVLPGLYWHVNDSWWVSSGLLLPVGPSNTAPSQWQFTCSFQF